MSESRVIIVGAGPAGALLAYLLASRGVAATLIERQSDFEREFRGEVLMPSGLRMLDAAGIDLKAIPHVRPDTFEGYRARSRFFELDLGQGVGEVPLIVSQPHLLEHLVAAAEREPGFRFLRGAVVRDLDRAGDRISGVRVQTSDGSEHLPASLVIGADGRASIVRRRQALHVENRGAPMDIVWFKVPWPAHWKAKALRAYIGGGHLMITLPSPDGRMQVAWVILKGTYGALRARGIEEWVAAMVEHVDPDLGAHLATNMDQIERPFLLDSETDRVVGWAQPGALVLGDAAHTMSPVGGQGLNVAMRDAVVAANHLVPTCLAGGDLDQAAAWIEPERGPEIDAIQRLAALPPRVVLGTGRIHSLARFVLTRVANSRIGRTRGGAVLGTFLYGTREVSLRV